ncbi:MAG: acetate/propionate family kinase [Acetobacteraceae bacterium]
MAHDAILALNAGSSSVKFALFAHGDGDRLDLALRGEAEGIGATPHFRARDPKGATVTDRGFPEGTPYDKVLDALLGFVTDHQGGTALGAVGHRIVHGGITFDRPVRVTDEVLAALDALIPFAPLHQPHNLAPIRAIAASRPDLPQVACFDTAFHHGMPVLATRFALPRALTDAGIRRYGFHGLSYEFIARRLRTLAPGLAGGRVIVAHLGNGASLCAMRGGRSVDTTMGLTALDGLMMGTRAGNLDPGVVLHLIAGRGMTTAAVEDLLYHRCGLLGVSGLSNDMRVLAESAEPHAAEAVALFVFRIARETGALAASLGGLDGFVFTAGIGAHAPQVRAAVCARLAWLGVRIDGEANARGVGRISAPDSSVAVWVIPTDEEAMIADHTRETLRG